MFIFTDAGAQRIKSEPDKTPKKTRGLPGENQRF